METITNDETYWLDYLLKPKEGEERVSISSDDDLKEFGEHFPEYEDE